MTPFSSLSPETIETLGWVCFGAQVGLLSTKPGFDGDPDNTRLTRFIVFTTLSALFFSLS